MRILCTQKASPKKILIQMTTLSARFRLWQRKENYEIKKKEITPTIIQPHQRKEEP